MSTADVARDVAKDVAGGGGGGGGGGSVALGATSDGGGSVAQRGGGGGSAAHRADAGGAPECGCMETSSDELLLFESFMEERERSRLASRSADIDVPSRFLCVIMCCFILP